MQKRLAVKPHLSLEEVEHQYRKAKDPVARSHWQNVWLLAQGKTTKQIVEYTGYGLSWIRTIAHRYNEGGPQALGDRRHGNPGAEAILSTEQQQQLWEALQSPPADQGLLGGVRTGRKVAAWIKEHTGRQVHPQRGWEYLRRLGGTLRVPRPRHAKADRASHDAFKKLPAALDQVQQAAPSATVELWAIDSHRIGLKPILRRVWVFNGQRPTVVVQHRYQWLYVYAFVHPAGPAHPVAAPAHRQCRNLYAGLAAFRASRRSE